MAKRKQKRGLSQELKHEAYGLVILTFGIIALVGYGKMRYFSYAFFLLAGSWGFIISLIFIGVGVYLMVKREPIRRLSVRWTGCLLCFLAVLLLAQIQFYEAVEPRKLLENRGVLALTWQQLWEQRTAFLSGQIVSGAGGGLTGAFIFSLFYFLFALNGTKLVSVMIMLLGLLLLTNRSFVKTLSHVFHIGARLLGRVQIKMTGFFQNQAARNEEGKNAASTHRSPVKKEPHKPTIKNEEGMDDMLGPSPSEIDAVSGAPAIHDFTEKSVYEGTEGSGEGRQQTKQTRVLNGEKGKEAMLDKADQMPDELLLESGTSESNGSAEQEMGAEMGLQFQALMADYQMPGFELLKRPKKGQSLGRAKDITQNAKKLEATLESFGVKARVVQVHRGPAVTRYELQPDVGVKVSRIISLTDDMAMALAAKDIRIEAPIPGKSALGIEVPNAEVAVVTLREVLESPAFRDSPSRLSVVLGRDISGEPIVGDLVKMPHLLVAGATGSGKSVCINAMIISILYKSRPDEVQFLMIDPKMVELSIYNEIPHLLIPVVTNPRKASVALKKVVSEMEHRYKLFAENGTRDIERYNQLRERLGEPKLPYIVVIIDELADLMMVAPTDVEEAVSRLAQMARASGIHLIIATQRPSVDVITGLIKANIPSRIAFGVSSQVDSRTILDIAGAEKLLGRGDMLYMPVGSSKPVRVQGAYLSDQEVEAVVNFVKSQQRARYRDDLIPGEQPELIPLEEDDELYETAMRLVVETQQASVSLLQRRLHIGYTRAARLIDALERHGVVGPYEGSKPREVLIKPEQVG